MYFQWQPSNFQWMIYVTLKLNGKLTGCRTGLTRNFPPKEILPSKCYHCCLFHVPDLKVSASTTNILPPSTLFSQYLESAITKMVCHVNTWSHSDQTLFLLYQFNKLILAMLWRLKCKIEFLFSWSIILQISLMFLHSPQIVRGLFVYDTTVFLNTCKSNFEEKGLD